MQDPALERSPYALTQWQIFQACMTREVLLVNRNRPLYFIRFFMLLVLALVTATLFVRTRMSPTSVADGGLYFGGGSSSRPNQRWTARSSQGQYTSQAKMASCYILQAVRLCERISQRFPLCQS